MSTDEVFGDAEDNGYAALKTALIAQAALILPVASADHWVQSYERTFGLPTLISYYGNYGPGQFPEN